MQSFIEIFGQVFSLLREPVGWLAAAVGAFSSRLALAFLNDSTRARQIVWLRITQATLIAFLVFLFHQVIFRGQGLSDLGVETLFLVLFVFGMSIFTSAVIGPSIDVLLNKLVRRSKLERNRRTDARDMSAHIPPVRKSFDPTKYFSENTTFIGLDEHKVPITCSRPMQNVLILGTTGGGKGVLLTSIAVQCALGGEAVFFGDPKTDDWAPHVLFDACRKAGVEYVFIDLQPDAPHQTNILSGASAEEIEELLSVAFSLDDSGHPGSDFYRPADRDAAAYVAKCAISGTTLARLYMDSATYLHDKAENFARRLKELAGMRCVNATEGVSLARIIEQGGVIYCRGSMRNPKVKILQRMLLVRLLQIAERRSTIDGEPRQLFTVLDEVRAWLSRPMVEFLSTARSKRVHVALAAQSLADIRDCPADMNPDSVVGSVVENCPIKAFYKVQDPTTASWVSEQTGTILVDDEIRSFESNALLMERVGKMRSVRQSERFLFDSNQVLNLPPSWAVLRGIGATRLVQICPSRVERDVRALMPTEYPGDELVEIEAKI